MINRYYEGENITNLISEYEIKTIPSRLVHLFPLVYTDSRCKHCNKIMFSKLVGRTTEVNSNKICISCKHREPGICNCEACNTTERKRKKEIEIQKQEIIANTIYPNKILDSYLDELDHFYLSILIRSGLDEDMIHIKPMNEIITKIAPTVEKTKKIYDHLVENKIIIPDFSKSHLNSFNIDFENKYITSYYPHKVYYYINIDFTANLISNLTKLAYPDSKLFSNEFCYSMWKNVALNETIENLNHYMNEVGFKYQSEDKIKMVFSNLLKNFSTGEIAYIIKKEIKNGTQLYQSKKFAKPHIENIIVSQCEKYGERVLANNWNVSNYKRDFNIEQSQMSSFLFNYILKIDDLGYNHKPLLDI